MPIHRPSEGRAGAAEKDSTPAAPPSGPAFGLKAATLLLTAVALGAFLSGVFEEGTADAARNSSGVYSLPSGNPVVSGTTITTSWANTTLGDLGAEVTNSLDRSGRGAMLAPLQCSSGTVAAPGLTFSADTGSGLYRAGSHDIRMAINGVANVKWNTGGTEFLLPVTVSGGFLNPQDGLTATNTTTNGNGIDSTGNGTGFGGSFTGGSSNGDGLVGYGAGNGSGVDGVGSGSREGGYFAAGTDATGATRSDAIVLHNGDIDFDGVAHVTSTTTVKNRATPDNIIKHWANMTTSAGASVTVNDGFNVTSATCGASNVTVTIPQAFQNTYYAVSCSAQGAACNATPASSTTYVVSCHAIATSSQLNLCGGATPVNCMAVGKQ